MNSIIKTSLVLVVAVCCFGSWSPVLAGDCITGMSTAELETSGPFAGFYKYTIVVDWTTTQGVSHITLDGMWACGAEACHNEAFTGFTSIFPEPAGTGTGEGGCTAEFGGTFTCAGDPSIGAEGVVIKWDVLDEGDACDASNAGTAILCFYADSAPNPNSPIASTAVKNGQNVCDGVIFGDFPLPCPVTVEAESWGNVKGLYR